MAATFPPDRAARHLPWMLDAAPMPALDPARFGDLARTIVVHRTHGPRLEVDPAEYVQLAHWAAERFTRRYRHFAPEVEETHGEAMVGLMRSCRLFRPSFGFKFTTYGASCVIRHLFRVYITNRLAEKHQAPVIVSLDQPRGTDKNVSMLDMIPTVDGRIEAFDRHDAQVSILDPLLRRLDRRSREIVHLRYWESMTLLEVSNRIGITRQRVQQLEEKALRKMGMPAGWHKASPADMHTPRITEREARCREKPDNARKADVRERVVALMSRLGCCTHTIALPHLKAEGLSVTQPAFDSYRRKLFPGQTPKRLRKPG